MFFLIEYNPNQQKIITLNSYVLSEFQKATEESLKLELKLKSENKNHEVVLFESESLENLKKTHQRYFKTLDEIVKDF